MKNHPTIRKIEDNQDNEQLPEDQREQEKKQREDYLEQNMLPNNIMNKPNPDIIP